MRIQDLSLAQFVGTNPQPNELGEFSETNIAHYDRYIETWQGQVSLVMQEKGEGWTYGLVNVPRWPHDVILVARKNGNETWTVAGGYWQCGFGIRPQHRGKGLSYYLIRTAFHLQDGLRPPNERVYSHAGLKAFEAAYRKAVQDDT